MVISDRTGTPSTPSSERAPLIVTPFRKPKAYQALFVKEHARRMRGAFEAAP
jgi:hypothetical protein